MACSCDPCALRFQDVVGGRFKLIPRERRYLPDISFSELEWENLALPINLAFFFYSTVENTSGIGVVPASVNIHPARACQGDKIIVSGQIAVHGIAIMSVREGLEFETQIESDSAALNHLVEASLAANIDVHVLRDPTRGGITSALTEIAKTAQIGIVLNEAQIPISEEVKGACEILGLDPLYVANEGKLLAVVPAEGADAVLAAMRAHQLGTMASVIGEVVDEHPGFVTMRTRVGGTRVVDMLSGEQLPRIC